MGLPKTLFDKIWDKHKVCKIDKNIDLLYIDTHLIHEVTSPQAFDGIRERNIKVACPSKTFAMPDHNIPTANQHLPIVDKLSRLQVEKLKKNCKDFGITYWGINHPNNGIVHVIGPQLGITQPGKTIVCGDSHTSTHGAFGTIAFGIGTSEVEMVLATQCIMQSKPKSMKIEINGQLQNLVTAKDVILYIISKIGAGGATGYSVEYSGSTISALSMEGRMTVCNMSIEMGAKYGLIAPDEKTYHYLNGKKYSPKDDVWNLLLKNWKKLKTDKHASFDKEFSFNAKDISPMISYGTNPSMCISIDRNIPYLEDVPKAEKISFKKSLEYMNFSEGEKLIEKKIDYIFMGSCTNGRIEDLRTFTNIVKGKKKAKNITAWIVPGSKQIERQAQEEGIIECLNKAGFMLRQPGCSACLAMNEDKIPSRKYAISTSNRNFEGRQGPNSRTLLASPVVAAITAIEGKIVDPRAMLKNTK